MVDRTKTECESTNPPWMVTMFQRILGISVWDINVHQDYIKIKGFTWADAGTIQDLFLFYFKLIKKNFVFYVTFRKFVRITIKKQHKARKDEFL